MQFYAHTARYLRFSTLQPHQHLVVQVILKIGIPVGMKQYLTLVLIRISLMTNAIEHFYFIVDPFNRGLYYERGSLKIKLWKNLWGKHTFCFF